MEAKKQEQLVKTYKRYTALTEELKDKSDITRPLKRLVDGNDIYELPEVKELSLKMYCGKRMSWLNSEIDGGKEDIPPLHPVVNENFSFK